VRGVEHAQRVAYDRALRHGFGTLLLLVAACLALAGASPIGTSSALAAPVFTSATASIVADSAYGPSSSSGNVALPPGFNQAVDSAGVSGANSDTVSAEQSSTLSGGALDFFGVVSESSLAVSADHAAGTAVTTQGGSGLTVDFSTGAEPTTVLIEGLLTARTSGAATSCTEVAVRVDTFAFEAADGPACNGGRRVVLDEAIHLDPSTAYTITLSLSTVTVADQGAGVAHAEASGSWDVDITLCTNPFTGGRDRITGTAGPDVLCGGGGADIIIGRGGSDTIKGGAGKDTLRGGAEPDDIWGGDGDDVVDGGQGDSLDRLHGGPGADRIIGGGGDDRIYGATPFDAAGDFGDEIRAGGGNDRIIGDRGKDLIEAAGGDDFVVGGRNGDTVRGGGGADTIRGEGGNDKLFGNRGEDLLDGGLGNDFANACDGMADRVVGGGGTRDRAVADRVDLVFGSTEIRQRC
jgi:Ca2+-binding RTX toxin-like protein